MLSAADLWTFMVAALIVLGAISLWCGVTVPAAILVGRVMRTRNEQDAQTAADFGEPTREQVEYGPRAMWGPISDTPIYDATAAHVARHEADGIDDEWAAIWDVTGGAA